MIDLSTPEARARYDLERGRKYPFHGRAPRDWAEAAALGVLADLCDRSGIKNVMREIAEDDEDHEISIEIVESLAAIIRESSPSVEQQKGDKCP